MHQHLTLLGHLTYVIMWLRVCRCSLGESGNENESPKPHERRMKMIWRHSTWWTRKRSVQHDADPRPLLRRSLLNKCLHIWQCKMLQTTQDLTTTFQKNRETNVKMLTHLLEQHDEVCVVQPSSPPPVCTYDVLCVLDHVPPQDTNRMYSKRRQSDMAVAADVSMRCCVIRPHTCTHTTSPHD